MGASGFSIEFEQLNGAECLPLGDLQPRVWELLADYVWRYTSSYAEVWNGYLGEIGPWDDWFSYDDQTVTFWFPDFAGSCTRSAGVSLHWIRAAFAANFHQVSTLAQDHGWLPSGGQPSLEDEVWGSNGRGWTRIDGRLYEFSFDADGGDRGVWSDGDFLEFSGLSDEARGEVEQAAQRRLCPCSMCVMLRPDPSFEASMVESLDDGNPDVVQSAIWYLRQSAKLSLDTALEIVRRGAGYHRDHAATCFDFGQKLSPAAADHILDEAQQTDDMMERCGLLGLVAGIELEDEQAVERRLFTFVSALRSDGPVKEVAAEYAGYGQVAKGHEDHFARALVSGLGTSTEYDHNVALTLFNFYMSAHAVPAFAVDAIGSLVAHDDEQVQGIAAFAHQQLSIKPTR